MGILDDAIREHLDLKRRQGAEDEEIDKLESEAFGPPSRPGDPDFAEPGQVPPTGEQALVSESAAGVPLADTADEPAVAEASPELFDRSETEPESTATPEPAGDLDLDDELGAPAPPPSDAEQPAIESFDTVEHHFEDAVTETGDAEIVEGELEPERSAEGPLTDEEDVLEETPEFLRDQPEDDELWFEQGEPKDFDF